MAWVIPRPFHDILAPFSPSETGLILLQIELTPDELNLWLTNLISASIIHDKADYIFPLWNASPVTASPTPLEDVYRDTWGDFDPEPMENVVTGTLSARGVEMDTGNGITFVTRERVITIPLRGIGGGDVQVRVDGKIVATETIDAGENLEFVIDTEKTQSTIEIEVL